MANLLILAPDGEQKHDILSLQHVTVRGVERVEVTLPYFDMADGSIHVVKVSMTTEEALLFAAHIVNQVADRL